MGVINYLIGMKYTSKRILETIYEGRNNIRKIFWKYWKKFIQARKPEG